MVFLIRYIGYKKALALQATIFFLILEVNFNLGREWQPDSLK